MVDFLCIFSGFCGPLIIKFDSECENEFIVSFRYWFYLKTK